MRTGESFSGKGGEKERKGARERDRKKEKKRERERASARERDSMCVYVCVCVCVCVREREREREREVLNCTDGHPLLSVHLSFARVGTVAYALARRNVKVSFYIIWHMRTHIPVPLNTTLKRTSRTFASLIWD